MKSPMLIVFSLFSLAAAAPNGADLSPLIEQAAAHSTIECLPAPAVYHLSRTTYCKAQWVTVNMHGASLDAQTSAGASANLYIQGQGFTLNEPHITHGATFARIYAPHCRITDAKSDNYVEHSGGTWSGISANLVWTDEGGDDFQIINSDIGVTGSVEVYSGGTSGMAENCLFRGSIGEYDFRREPSTKDTNSPGPFILKDSTFVYVNVKDKLSVIGVRLGCVQIINCNIEANVRYGEEPKGPPPIVNASQCAPNCLISNCRFLSAASLPVGDKYYIAPIALYEGAQVSGAGNEFWLTNGHSAVTEDTPSAINLNDSKIHYPATLPVKPVLYAQSCKGVHTDVRTTLDTIWNPAKIESSVPTTQPTTTATH